MDKQAYYNSLQRFQMVKEAALAKQAFTLESLQAAADKYFHPSRWERVKQHFKDNWQDYAGAVGVATGSGLLAKLLGASNQATALATLAGGAAGGLGTHYGLQAYRDSRNYDKQYAKLRAKQKKRQEMAEKTQQILDIGSMSPEELDAKNRNALATEMILRGSAETPLLRKALEANY